MCRGRLLGSALIVHGAVRPMQPELLQILWDGRTNFKGRADSAYSERWPISQTKQRWASGCSRFAPQWYSGGRQAR